ncbi:MAG: molybdopterin synthase catalytic subunit [bacterium]|nr:MAG: molybdopterin synthase catalytic subunit [bacterium]
MIVLVRCFAGLRDEIGSPEVDLEIPAGADVARLKQVIETRWPRLAGRLGSVRVAADFEFLGEDEVIPPGAEIALIPPVSGGAAHPVSVGPDVPADGVRILLTEAPLVLAQLIDFVRCPAAGAVVTFLGTVRDTSRGQAVVELEYEAYPEMARSWLIRLAIRVRERHAVDRIAIAHRTGIVPVSGESVAIAVSAVHRAEAFDACRALIEGLKADVPIWKRERYESGEVWVGWGS